MELNEVNCAFDTAEETTELLPPSHRDNMQVESYFIEYAVQKEMINRNRCTASRRLLGQTAQSTDFNLVNANHQKVKYRASLLLFLLLLFFELYYSSTTPLPTYVSGVVGGSMMPANFPRQLVQLLSYVPILAKHYKIPFSLPTYVIAQKYPIACQDSPCVGISMIHTSNANWPPSRKREEARALENLRKRVEQSKLYKATRISDTSAGSASGSLGVNNDRPEQLDNRPKLLKKILSNRPMSIAHDSNDLETDWRDSEFITECLCWHNVYRQRHNAPPLTMSPQLCEYAQTWANHLAHTNTFYYRNDREVGQNLYCRPGGAVPTDVTGQDVASYWYSAVKQYDFLKEPDILHANVNAGHFTQVIWASSSYFGVGKARSRSGKIIVVANYQPVGNTSGHFQNNVLPPLPENLSVAVSPPPQSSSKIFRDHYVASDSPPPPPASSSVLPLSDTASTGSDRSSVSSTQ